MAEKVTKEHAQGEDSELTQPKKWTQIAKEFNERMGGDSMRKPRQCRERWINAIDPSVNKKKFKTSEQLEVLLQWRTLGPKWHEIASKIPGRTEIQVKNNFNC